MACSHDLFGGRIVQHAGLLALLHEHQIFDVAFRTFHRAEIQPAHSKSVGSRIAHGIVQHFAVGGGVTHAKAQMCMELIENAVGAGHKVLLFSQFTSMLERLAAGLKKAGIDYYMLTGSVGKEKRMQMVESFNEDDVPVFCISLKAGGTGLNLTAADIVIHYDPWWNVAVQNQATDRAHRIGQKHVVTVEGTIEEKIIAIQERKKELAKQVLEGEGMDSVSFTKEEILELLG